MWNPDVYMKFGDLRTRPALELALRAGTTEGLIYDLGCGPGNSAEVLRTLNPDARLVGVDSSPEMLARAVQEGPKDATWIEADLLSWVPDEKVDLVFSNATYQWLDGHGELFPALFQSLAPGGTLAIQMPQNFSAPSHVIMRQTALDGPWSEKLAPILRHDPVGTPQDYYDLFCADASDLDIWETEYAQVLEGADPVFDWVSGTALRPLLALLDEAETAAYTNQYKAALREAYPKRRDGKTLFPFKRIFLVIRA